MLHILRSHHRTHFKELGIKFHFFHPLRWFHRTEPSHYIAALLEWRKTLPHATIEELHTKALGHVAWAKYARSKQK